MENVLNHMKVMSYKKVGVTKNGHIRCAVRFFGIQDNGDASSIEFTSTVIKPQAKGGVCEWKDFEPWTDASNVIHWNETKFTIKYHMTNAGKNRLNTAVEEN